MKCTSDLPDYIAAFLIGAGEYCYFGCDNWISERDGTEPFTRCPEYDKPLGAPRVQHNTMQEYGPDHLLLVLKLCLIPKGTRKLLTGDQIKPLNLIIVH